MSLKQIMIFEDEASISFVESLLKAEIIHFLIAGTDYLPTTLPRLLVHAADIERARSLLIEAGFENQVYSERRLRES